MAKLTGEVLYISETQHLQSMKGNTYRHRTLAIAVQTFDSATGESKVDRGNTPMFELTGACCQMLDSVAVGQTVTIDYNIQGRRYRDKNNKERISTEIKVFAVRPYKTSQIPAVPVQVNATVQSAPESKKNDGDLPF